MQHETRVKIFDPNKNSTKSTTILYVFMAGEKKHIGNMGKAIDKFSTRLAALEKTMRTSKLKNELFRRAVS